MANTKIPSELIDGTLGVAGISSSADATAITIDSSENVGIGATASSTKFQVSQDADNAYIAKFDQDHATGWGVLIDTDATAQGDPALWVKNASDTIIWAGSAGKIGIGSLSTDGKVDIAQDQNTTAASFTTPHLALTATDTTNTTGFTGISYASSTLTNYGWTVGAQRTSTTGGTNSFVFRHHSNSATGTERMRIDESGRVLIGWTSSVSSTAQLQVNSNAKIGNIFLQGNSTNSKLIAGNAEIRLSSLEFRGGGSGLDFDVTLIKTGVGFTNMFKVDSPSGDTFTNDGTISSLSDERIKTDINDLTDGLDIVKQLRPVTFKYNDTTEDEEGKKELGTADDTVRYGFIAQEVEEVAPHYVETSTRKINNVEVDDFKSMSTTRMIPMLFKAIQELEARVKELEG